MIPHFSNVYSLRTILIITRLPGHYPASSKSPNTSGSRLTNDGRSRITRKKQALPCSHESAESLSQSVSQATPLVVFVYYFRNVLFGLFDPHAPTVSGSNVTSTYKILCTVQRVNKRVLITYRKQNQLVMTDESKVKTTFIRPVNRTMSYEDRRGYVCMYVCDRKAKAPS